MHNHQSFHRLGESISASQPCPRTVHWRFFLHVSPSLIWLHLHQCPSIPWGQWLCCASRERLAFADWCGCEGTKGRKQHTKRCIYIKRSALHGMAWQCNWQGSHRSLVALMARKGHGHPPPPSSFWRSADCLAVVGHVTRVRGKPAA